MSALYKGSTGIVAVSFIDEAGVAVVPNEITWTLLKRGQVVNSRKDVPVEIPASQINIILSGADLVGGPQVLCVHALYDSSLGEDLPLKIFKEFEVINSPC